ncbi:DUF3052 family protein [Mucilaginibacter paludis]|uniref:DUF3052 domain-containing protein n=1 Tax=Mucilaginibacter paludis DSM 18603 TaxID=714943 RepID=H1Y581_9SPHI|nr:DUF3052 family protein [Mucilaginibacter paludis]EHQ28624.1 hypothetical protein Mucpa_4534 [Mucilaginibacter paludis DSM 18603]
MQTAGYSGTPLAKKLGIKAGFKVMLVNAPEYYPDLFTDLPPDIVFVNDAHQLKDLIHIFVDDKAGYLAQLPLIKTQIVQNGSIWVSWPKKASKIKTDITEDVIRNYALQTGLVDVKVCAVNEVWSALKLVIRLADRK